MSPEMEKEVETKPTLTLTLEQLIRSCSAMPGELTPLQTLNSSKYMWAVQSMNLRKIIRQIDVELKDYQDTWKEVLNKYADKDEKGEIVVDENGAPKFTDENRVLVNTEHNLLMDKVVTLEGTKFTLKDIGEKTEISALYLDALDWLIQED
jgi:hypothetical protein